MATDIPINIPTEIIRTIVVVSETGSFTKAGERLNLGQPAISAQMKRLQTLVGAPVFEKTSGARAVLTATGQLIVTHARRLLEAHDQILAVGGTDTDGPPLRVGVATAFAPRFLAAARTRIEELNLTLQFDHTREMVSALGLGLMDVVFGVNMPAEAGDPLVEWSEPFLWACAKDFQHGPGRAIPLICWAGSYADQQMITALESAGYRYRIALTSVDFAVRGIALAAGFGVMGLPERFIEKPIRHADDFGLPAMPPIHLSLVVRPGMKNDARLEHVMAAVRHVAPEPAPRKHIRAR